jgi:type IV secretion system protein VirD4
LLKGNTMPRSAPVSSTFGSARFASRGAIERAGLFRDFGLILGSFEGRYLRDSGPGHVLAVAPTRSGKGVGLVVPSLLASTGSVLVHDIKGENWALTSGWRAQFSRCLMFNPASDISVRFNPLLEVRRGVNEVRDAQAIADMLVDPEGRLEQRSHWDKTAHAFLTGLILHVLYADWEKTLARLCALISDPARPVEALLKTMLTARHLDGRPHPVAAAAARDLLNKAENERSGVISTAVSLLTLYRDPLVAKATSASDFCIADLVSAFEPVSLYLGVPASDLSRTRPLIRLLLHQILNRLTESLEAVSLGARQPLLLMLDEFPALGRIDFFEGALAFLAGYKIKACLIAQSLNQIDKAYGENNAILDNCQTRVLFAPNDERTAKRISDALGTATQERQLKSFSGQRAAFWLSHASVSRQESPRPLMTPGEILQLPPKEALILAGGVPPILGGKVRYFEDRNFLERCLPPASLRKPRAASVRHDWESVPSGTPEPDPELATSEPHVDDEFAILNDPGVKTLPSPKPPLRIVKEIGR